MTSDELAKVMQTHPVVVRRVMAGLRDSGLVRSEKGHGGGWVLSCNLSDITLGDIYRGVLPFVVVNIVALAIVMAFPPLATWLPSLMH